MQPIATHIACKMKGKVFI